MVKFDELRISDCGNYLTIECHIENYDVYSEMYINTVYLEYYKNRGSVGVPSEHSLLVFENNNETPSDVRAVRVRVALSDLPSDFGTNVFEGGLFYVYVNCDGNLPAEVSTMHCSFDNTQAVGIIVDWKALYKQIMPYVAKLSQSCNPCDSPSGFEHMILLWNAFKFAVDTCDWVQIDRIWGELMGTATTGHVSSGCGCFGR